MKSKAQTNNPMNDDDDIGLPKDLSKLKMVRGKYYRRMLNGYTIRIRHSDGTYTEQHIKPKELPVLLDPDVREYFPTSEAVNETLRALIKVAEQMSQKEKARMKRTPKAKAA